MKDDGALASWASELVMVVVPYGVIVCASPIVVRVVTAGDDEDVRWPEGKPGRAAGTIGVGPGGPN
jgi:hypothetical protein